jgi:probable F420-dependent oxidoreductase
VSERPFRFGVSASQAESGADLASKARRADELGYDTFLVADHLLELLSPFAALGFAAEATSRIKLGTLVLNNDFRHPALVAREAATLQLLSGGRFELGIGAGHAEVENASVGLPFDTADRRIERLGEALDIITALRTGESVTYSGEHYTLREHSLYPQLATPMPLLVGGNGKRVLQLAARHADIIGFTGFFPSVGAASKLTHFTEAGLANRIDIVRNAAPERFDDIELNCLVQGVVVTDEPAPVFERLSASTGLPPETFESNPFYLVGSVDGICEQLQLRRAELGVSYYAVFEKDMETLAPVVARLGGA